MFPMNLEHSIPYLSNSNNNKLLQLLHFILEIWTTFVSQWSYKQYLQSSLENNAYILIQHTFQVDANKSGSVSNLNISKFRFVGW